MNRIVGILAELNCLEPGDQHVVQLLMVKIEFQVLQVVPPIKCRTAQC